MLGQSICLKHHKSAQQTGAEGWQCTNKQDGCNRKMGGKNSLTEAKLTAAAKGRESLIRALHTAHFAE
jgi:hypothetical protein